MSDASSRPPDALRESPLTATYLIARREFVTRARSRIFLISTALLLIMIAGYIVLQARVLNKKVTTISIAFVGDTQVLASPLAAAMKPLQINLNVQTVPDVSTGENEVRAGSLDVLVSGSASAPTVGVKEQLDSSLQQALTGLVRLQVLDQALTAQGISPAGITAALLAAKINIQTLDPNAAQRTQRTVVAFFVAVILYVTLLVYGQFVAQGVVEEKQNRIVEVLLSTVRPRELLFGKVVGIGLVGVVQLAAVGAVALLVLRRTQAITIPNVGIETVAAGLVWYVLGFLTFALLFAGAASLVSRQDEIASVTLPITVLIVATYLAFFWLAANPDNPAAIALSMLPGFAPVLMPARIASGDAALWQVALAVVLAVATIIGLNALAARIYANSVLRTGARVSLRDALGGRG